MKKGNIAHQGQAHVSSVLEANMGKVTVCLSVPLARLVSIALPSVKPHWIPVQVALLAVTFLEVEHLFAVIVRGVALSMALEQLNALFAVGAPMRGILELRPVHPVIRGQNR